MEWRPARLDWLVIEERRTVDAAALPSDTVFLYSIPTYDELGGGQEEPRTDIGSGKLLLTGGEVLVSKLNPRIPRVLQAEAHEVPTLASTEFIALRPGPKIEPRYLRYWLLSEELRQALDAATMSVTRSQQRVRPEVLTKMWVRFPSRASQRAIADYLDTETARIDAVIQRKQRMVALLAEVWTAVVLQAVAPRWAVEAILYGVRDGEVCPGWRIRKLLHLTMPGVPIAYGILLPGERLGEGVPYIGSGDVRPDRLNLDVLPRTTPDIAAQYPRTRMGAGELVYAIRGSFGAVEQIPDDLDGVNLSRDAARIAPHPEVNPRWLMYALKSEVAQEQFKRREVGATITGVNIEDLKSVRLPVPPRDEQNRIVERLDATRASYERLTDCLRTQLTLLLEHRQALISAAVTGELTVPGVAA